MTLSTTVTARIKAIEEITGEGYTTVSSFDDASPITMATGTAASLADLKFSEIATIGTGGTTYDLNALVDGDGRTIAMVKVKALLVKADSANTNTIIVGAASSNQFQGPFDTATWTATLPANGQFLIVAPVAGWACTTGVSDKLKIAGGAAAQIYTLQIVGTSA